MEKNELDKLGLRSLYDQENAKSENFIKIYANNVTLGATNWDLSLLFGEIVGLNEKGVPVVEQKVKVNMTREFVKALSNLLSLNIKHYEEKFGEIGFVNIEDMPTLDDIGPEDLIKKPVLRKRKSK